MSDPRHTPLGPGAEFDAIRALLEQWGPFGRGAGDDAAVLDVPAGQRLVASIDTCIEGVHFRPGWLSPAEVGYRAVTAALSDLAAMAASPLGVLTAFDVPEWWRDRLAEIGDGVAAAVAAAGTAVSGGNISAAPQLGITTAVLGAVAPEHLLLRSGVSVGDILYVTGRLGGPGAALAAFMDDRAPEAQHRARFVHPTARLREGRWLAAAGARAAVDISDGLSADAGHLAAAGGVGIEIDLAAVPVVDGVTPRDALSSGEEYELLIAAPEALDAAAFAAEFGIPLTPIGRAVEVHPGEVDVRDDGRHVAGGPGHDHFHA